MADQVRAAVSIPDKDQKLAALKELIPTLSSKKDVEGLLAIVKASTFLEQREAASGVPVFVYSSFVILFNLFSC